MAPGTQSGRDVHALTPTLHTPFCLPCSCTFSVKPPQLRSILALANTPPPPRGPVLGLSAARGHSGCAGESRPCSSGQQALMKLSAKGNMYK